MRLRDDEIDSFKENGFLLLRGFTEETLCDEIRELATKHLYEMVEPIESEEEYLQQQRGTKTRAVYVKSMTVNLFFKSG